MNMLERFLSVEYEGRGEVFHGSSIWKNEKYQNIQGTWPVIFLSFADVKANTFAMAREKICMLIKEVYRKYDFLLSGGSLKEGESELFRKVLWYDGFTFGKCRDIYNPWSIINYLRMGKLSTYWANTSSNGLVDKLIREGSTEIKISMENLLKVEHLYKGIDEQIM